MKIVGGLYEERCVFPEWEAVYGSAGRAAAAIGRVYPVELHCYTSSEALETFQATAAESNIRYYPILTPKSSKFTYLHPLARPTYAHSNVSETPTVKGSLGLVYGTLEDRLVCEFNKVVYDPQSSTPRHYDSNGSTANDLIYVLNQIELANLSESGSSMDAQANELLENFKLTAVIVKMGALGARIFASGIDKSVFIPAYKTPRVFKIGSGDVFSAGFAYAWGVQGMDIETSARYASKNVSLYVSTKDAVLRRPSEIDIDLNAVEGVAGSIYIAAPFFSTEQMWLVEEIKRLIIELGARPISPYHIVGFGPPEAVAVKDVELIKQCDAVIAVMNGCDPGTIFEIGYARSIGKPVTVLSERNLISDLTMLSGTGCKIASDISSAVYNAIWESCRV